jgi:hypothetical protein
MGLFHCKRGSIAVMTAVIGGERWSAWSLQRFASVKWVLCRLIT